ncbi:ABC transporter permease [Streptomyces sp. ISL-11]|uniref:ABC transporter permease n=1 Tax=Streptomyces sp. ISL-11 TaxID=2819174 RepID=UPI001BE78FD2|nr:ABC transporter permease [Streptomyces sp. ISL-11]MBT2386686.1 ABC transporter permease [Streptomyces sp. ISL-11]
MNNRLRRILATGWNRGWLLIKNAAFSKLELFGLISGPAVLLFFASQRSGTVAGTGVELSLLMITGGVAMSAAMEALVSTPGMIGTDREDGTLLRLRGTPDGMPAYLLGRFIHIVARAVAAAILMLLAGRMFFDSPLPQTPERWLTLAWVLVLGIAATVPLGAVLGSLLPSARAAVLLQLPVYAVIMLSGIFTPFTALPKDLQYVIEVFPVKWMAQGMRSALLPDQMLAVESGHSWQRPLVALVLVAWAVLGAWAAPRLMMRVARKESGSKLAARQDAATQRGAL